jgi:hypothetical protein
MVGYADDMNGRSLRRVVLVLGAAYLATAVALGGAELVLVDGQVVRGESVRKEGDVYVLTTATGDVTMPVDLVDQVRLTGQAETAPTGIKAGGPRTLAGGPVEPARTDEQLAVFGKPAEWQKSSIDPNWVPESDWNMDPGTQNNWNPSTWAQSSIDPNWTPTSAYDANEDVLADSRSTWQQAPTGSTWVPTDGFKKSAW